MEGCSSKDKAEIEARSEWNIQILLKEYAQEDVSCG